VNDTPKRLEKYREQIYHCVRCGDCRESTKVYTSRKKESSSDFHGVCPAREQFGFEAYSARGRMSIFRDILEGRLEITPEIVEWAYSCTTCDACRQICRVRGVTPEFGLDVPAVVEALHGELVENGTVPSMIGKALNNTFKHGNPWGRLQSDRDRWAENLNVKRFKGVGKDGVLLYIGCISSYDMRCQETARSMVAVLNKAGVDYGILGNEEGCCGDQTLRMGEVGLFETIAQKNIELFEKYGVRKIVTLSPHSYNTFKNDYPSLGGNYEVLHHSQFLWELIKEKRLQFLKRVNKVVTYQDPCFLGRHNKIYDAPRNVLEAIPGLTLVEMPRNREASFCCGGGGGRMWIEDKSTTRISDIRAKEALGVNPDIVATACPFCLVNLEDAVKNLENSHAIVEDILQLVNEAT
jgi:Fe-S oxidoreductase